MHSGWHAGGRWRAEARPHPSRSSWRGRRRDPFLPPPSPAAEPFAAPTSGCPPAPPLPPLLLPPLLDGRVPSRRLPIELVRMPSARGSSVAGLGDPSAAAVLRATGRRCWPLPLLSCRSTRPGLGSE